MSRWDSAHREPTLGRMQRALETPNRRADVDALRAVIADVEMIALYVFVKREGRWMIAARQNTLVAA